MAASSSSSISSPVPIVSVFFAFLEEKGVRQSLFAIDIACRVQRLQPAIPFALADTLRVPSFALDTCVHRDHLEGVELALKRGGKPTRRTIEIALRHNRLPIVQAVMESFPVHADSGFPDLRECIRAPTILPYYVFECSGEILVYLFTRRLITDDSLLQVYGAFEHLEVSTYLLETYIPADSERAITFVENSTMYLFRSKYSKVGIQLLECLKRIRPEQIPKQMTIALKSVIAGPYDTLTYVKWLFQHEDLFRSLSPAIEIAGIEKAALCKRPSIIEYLLERLIQQRGEEFASEILSSHPELFPAALASHDIEVFILLMDSGVPMDVNLFRQFIRRGCQDRFCPREYGCVFISYIQDVW